MQNPYLALLRTAWQYARQEKRRFVFVYFLFILANIIAAMHPLLFGWFVTTIQQKDAPVQSIVLWYAAGYLALRLGEWCFHGPARVMERELAFTLSRNFLMELYHQTINLPVSWHKDHHSGSTINRIRKANDALKTFFQSGFVYLHTIFKCLFSFGAMMYFSPVFGTIGVMLGALTVWLIMKFDKPFIKAVDESNEREHQVSSTLFDSLSNIITVITLRLEKQMETSLLGKVMAVLPPFRRHVRINEWKWFVASMMIALIYGVITAGYVYQHYIPGEVFVIGGLVTLLGYINQFNSVFTDIAFQYTEIVQFNTDVQTARSIGQAYAQQHRPETVETLPARWQTIDIEGLNFRHTKDDDLFQQLGRFKRAGLHDLSIRIQRGQRIALIGESGSGKSTLLTLLRGLYKPEPGIDLRVDDQAYADLSLIADTVTLMPQEPEIFENTIEYNITLGLPFSEDDIQQACETARFTDVVNQLPNGMETSIQEKGVNLSGGQKQRLALARGVLAARSSDIILLDEPTSSVDPKTEFEIYHRMLTNFRGKAVISTLHRLHLLTMFDYIYILGNGHVIDEGSFVELRERSSTFQKMWEHQKVQQHEAHEVERIPVEAVL
ncbi:ABC-type multidrug transport system fused ATPase/permease subunit [Larkinella arboricola]|uniref:ABC-type multidrug transport system fused ATPase/permease subunit n=1 Tax=Larkinella arboricola TaxID=643671 RepID=A0A327WT63_LARAB|nr:ABC transporter ATP-binding protein [Larkinella arboricola]RAJ95693.1 ABC-type multidrug transport system fused ATPase/permease subunit [Larkinella arboricola]